MDSHGHFWPVVFLCIRDLPSGVDYVLVPMPGSFECMFRYATVLSYQERLGLFESLIIKMRDFEPVGYIYFLFVGQCELRGTNLHGLGGYL